MMRRLWAGAGRGGHGGRPARAPRRGTRRRSCRPAAAERLRAGPRRDDAGPGRDAGTRGGVPVPGVRAGGRDPGRTAATRVLLLAGAGGLISARSSPPTRERRRSARGRRDPPLVGGRGVHLSADGGLDAGPPGGRSLVARGALRAEGIGRPGRDDRGAGDERGGGGDAGGVPGGPPRLLHLAARAAATHTTGCWSAAWCWPRWRCWW